METESGNKYRRRSSEKRIGVFTDSGNAGYLGGSGARLPPLCGARIEAIVGNDLSLRATAEDVKRHVVVKAKKSRPSIPNVDEVSVQTDVGLSNDDRSYVLGKTRSAIAKLGQANFGELAGFMKDSMDSRFGPEWQCVVGTKEAFGSCLSPVSSFYVNLSVDRLCFLLFKS